MVEWIGEDVLDRYIDAVEALSVASAEDIAAAKPLKLVYTPLNGAGSKPVRQLMMNCWT